MDFESTISKLRELIADAQEDQAIDQLLILSKTQPPEVSDQIYSLSATYKKNLEDVHYGVVSGEEERLANNDLNRRLLFIVNSLQDPALVQNKEPQNPESSTITTPTDDPSSPASSKNFWQKYRPYIMGTIIVSLIGMLLMIMKTKQTPVFGAELWQGVWAQQQEGTQDKKIKGTLEFEVRGPDLVGRAISHYPNGLTSKTVLFNIVLDQRKKSIKGQWQSEELNKEGRFEFLLRNKNSFKGFYQIAPNFDDEFSWNGSR